MVVSNRDESLIREKDGEMRRVEKNSGNQKHDVMRPGEYKSESASSNKLATPFRMSNIYEELESFEVRGVFTEQVCLHKKLVNIYLFSLPQQEVEELLEQLKLESGGADVRATRSQHGIMIHWFSYILKENQRRGDEHVHVLRKERGRIIGE